MVVMLLCITGKSVIKSKYNLNSITYILQSKKISEEICLIQITDLHNSIFGSDNKHLISKAAMKSPDLIMITGDLLNANEPDNNIVVTLLAELSAIAQHTSPSATMNWNTSRTTVQTLPLSTNLPAPPS